MLNAIQIHRVSVAGVDLGFVYQSLGRGMVVFTNRWHETRPDECRRFLAEHAAARARAELAAQAIDDAIREATRGVPKTAPTSGPPTSTDSTESESL